MQTVLARFLTMLVAFAVVTSGILPGIYFTGDSEIVAMLIAGVIFAAIQLFVRPILLLLTCPLLLLTMGLAGFAISLGVLYLTAFLTRTIAPTAGELVIESLTWGIIASLVIGVLNSILEFMVGARRRRRPPVQRTEVRHVIVDRRDQADAQFRAMMDDDDDFDVVDPQTGQPK